MQRTRAALQAAATLLLATATTLSAHAATIEVRVDGLVAGHIPGPLPATNGSYNIPGYERLWNYGAPQDPASPFGMPTASRPFDYLYGNRSALIAELPVTMTFEIDTSLLPPLSAGSSAQVTHHDSQLYAWLPHPVITPYVPWMRASLTINGHTQTYTGDFSATATLYDLTGNSRGVFELRENTTANAGGPQQAGVFDISGLHVDFSFAQDVLTSSTLAQNFSFSNAAGLAGVSANFNVYETAFATGGGRLGLVQDIGNIHVTGFSMHTVPSPVPEPASSAMLISGLLGVAVWGRRRQQTATLR